MKNSLVVTADLINDKVKFSGVSRDNHEIMIDYVSPIGDDNGYTPLELFLLSLATCSGMTIILLLRKMHKEVLGLRVMASGNRRDTNPTYFESIFLTFEIESKDVQLDDMEKVLRLSEESICPVWNMVRNNVEITKLF
ncbi:OsmC family protein [Pseudobacteroides cellulosolvens]|uniref:OsmC family protein n=1 Tax=Pseudobacteroides cellulosolvens ATCC 35603 = DSM 2933 TaxID=398512 RepID=A0A0L6JIH4_9FIRM|nr:OsmC family protein [Pseudobacteroides cellulosolvens]KNY25539.1 OsmC family protein [Pseudobacteroides cellulosolvens ATCC 35603 = DSM 2933]